MITLALITLVSFLIYVYLGTFVFLKNPENSLNRVFFIFSVLTAWMCFADFQLRIAQTYEAAVFWQRAGVLWHLILSALLHFVLVFVRLSEHKHFKLVLIPNYAAGGLFALLDFIDGRIIDGPQKSPWGWSYGSPQQNWLGNVYLIWCAGLFILGIILCFRYYLQVKNKHAKIKARYVLIGTSIPIITGFGEVLFSRLQIVVPNLLEISFVVGSAFWAYAIWRYELFVLSPATTAKEIIQTMSDVLFVISPARTIKIVNQAAIHLFGYHRHELIDQSVNLLLDPDTYQYLEQGPIGEELRVKGYVSDAEISVNSKKGKKISISLAGTIIRDKDGQFQGIAFIGRDITKRKMEERELRRYQDHLKEIVAERTAELEKTYAQLQRVQKLEFMGTVAGGVAHDLNNILSGIVSYPELLMMKLPEDSPLINPLITIKKTGEKAATIVKDLLTLARREVLVRKIVNLNRVVREYLQSPEMLKLQTYHPGTRIVSQLAPGLNNIVGSPVHLSKTLMNLVHNGLEAMSSGGQLTVVTSNKQIDEPIAGYEQIEPGSYVCLSVRDEGVGIPADDLDRIFEPFYTKKKMGQSGTGLGMAVVWGTIKDHYGYVDVASQMGKGTTFTLYFPASTQPEEAEPVSVPAEQYMGKGETVLVVDDVEEQREIACGILESLGYVITTVPNGESAVAFVKENHVDILLLDMIMGPGIDGLETYQQILEFRPHQKAIIASGYTENERVKEARKLGVGAFITKPYSLEMIGLAIRTELDKSLVEA